MSPTLADPAVYAEVYATHLSFIKSVIINSGCPTRHLDDVTSYVVLAMINARGLEKFDPSRSSMRTYLARYAALAARTALAHIWAQENRRAALEPDLEAVEDVPTDSGADFEEFLDRLLAATADQDAQVFILTATRHPSYAKTRAELVEQGWESNRIRRAVRRGRASVSACL